MLLALSGSWMHVNRGEGCVVTATHSLHLAVPLTAPVDVEVLGADVEVLLLTLGEVEAMGVDGLPVVTSTSDWWLFWCCLCRVGGFLSHGQKVERLWVNKHGRSPIAQLSIITNTHDLVLVVIPDHGQTVHGVLMTVLG